MKLPVLSCQIVFEHLLQLELEFLRLKWEWELSLRSTGS